MYRAACLAFAPSYEYLRRVAEAGRFLRLSPLLARTYRAGGAGWRDIMGAALSVRHFQPPAWQMARYASAAASHIFITLLAWRNEGVAAYRGSWRRRSAPLSGHRRISGGIRANRQTIS